MEEFSSITYEAYIAGSWVDLTADVRHNPSPRISSIGIMGNSITNRTGDVGTLTFSLKNDTSNSGGVIGYYSPGHPNVRSGWTHGLRIRVTFAYDGYSKVYDGFYIDADGIEVVTGVYRERMVNVRASNWFRTATDHKMDLMVRKTNYNIFNSVQDILDNSERQPPAVKWWGHGGTVVTFPTVFDIASADTKAIGEFDKLARSEFGYVYMRNDRLTVESLGGGRRVNAEDGNIFTAGQLIPKKNSDDTEAILDEDGTELLDEDGTNILEEKGQRASFTDADIKNMSVLYGKNLANKVKFTLYPRTVDGSVVVLSTLEEPIAIAAGETLTEIRNQYKDPNNPDVTINSYDWVTPVATTDYQMFANEDGTGTDYTANLTVVAEYGNAEVNYPTLTNGAASAAYITKLDARGKGIYVYDTIDKTYQNATSITAYDVRELTLDCPYLDSIDSLYSFADKTAADIFATGLLSGVALNEMTIESVTFDINRSSKLMLAFMFLDAGDVLKLYETLSEADSSGGYASYDAGWFINGYDVEILNNRLVRWTCVMKYTSRT